MIREETPNDPKLSDGRGWRDRCMAGGKEAAEAAGVTAGAVRCSAWLGVAVIIERVIALLFGKPYFKRAGAQDPEALDV